LPRLRLPFRTLLEDLHIAWPLSVELLIDYALRFGDRYVILLYLSVATSAAISRPMRSPPW